MKVKCIKFAPPQKNWQFLDKLLVVLDINEAQPKEEFGRAFDNEPVFVKASQKLLLGSTCFLVEKFSCKEICKKFHLSG